MSEKFTILSLDSQPVAIITTGRSTTALVRGFEWVVRYSTSERSGPPTYADFKKAATLAVVPSTDLTPEQRKLPMILV